MKIKITENNKEKLENALAQANGKCKERLAHAEDLYKAVDRIRENPCSFERLGIPWMPCSLPHSG